eukprot:COSAG01_NODE_61093_length_291_cov_0.796875_1_plen_25_part_01
MHRAVAEARLEDRGLVSSHWARRFA